jgi:hypothetical protein
MLRKRGLVNVRRWRVGVAHRRLAWSPTKRVDERGRGSIALVRGEHFHRHRAKEEGAPKSGAPRSTPRVFYWMGTVALKTRLFPWKTLMVAVPPKVGVMSSGQEPEAQTFENVI